MSDLTNGDGSAFSFDRKLDRLSDSLANLTASMQLQRELADHQFALSEKRHEFAMEELREMRELQREMRIDIMALFHGNDKIRALLEKHIQGSGTV